MKSLVRSAIVSFLIIEAVCALLTVISVYYFNLSTRVEIVNAGTAVAAVVFLLGLPFLGPLSFAHGDRLDPQGYRPTPATENPANRFRGVVVIAAAIAWLLVVIAADLATRS